MILALTLLACTPDDVTDKNADDTAGDTSEDTSGGDGGPGDISGSWVSEGDDISDLFAGAPFNYTRIDASFDVGGSYVVTVLDSGGTASELTGTYASDATTNPGTIVLTQTAPYAATAQGIWQVVDEVLTYEVVQTTPDYGFTPPTPESGFGTTAGPNLDPGVNVQVFRRP